MLARGIPASGGDFLLKVLKQNSRGGDETKDAFNLEGFIRKAALE